jgi:hypothetical protein
VEFFWIIFLVVGFAILIRMVQGSSDKSRVLYYLQDKGCKLIEIHWVPFGPGWFGKHHDRIYEVRFIDKDGNRHHAFCKTSGWSGVYFTEDRIESSNKTKNIESLEDENRRLRMELEQLRRERN